MSNDRQPQRIQLRRTKGYRKPEGAVVVARPTRWGNPWVVGTEVESSVAGLMAGPYAGYYDPDDVRHFDLLLPQTTLDAATAVWLYRTVLEGNLADGDPYFDELRAALSDLRGHDLACWCPLAQPCHADVLLELANDSAAHRLYRAEEAS